MMRVDNKVLGRLLNRLPSFPGNVVIVAAGGKGKTELAERLVSCVPNALVRLGFPVACIMGALRTWASPTAALAMVKQGIVTAGDADRFASAVLSHIGISNALDVVSRVAFSDAEAVRGLYSASRMVGYGMVSEVVGGYRPLYFVEAADGTKHFDFPLGEPGSEIFLGWAENELAVWRDRRSLFDAKGDPIAWSFVDVTTDEGRAILDTAIDCFDSGNLGFERAELSADAAKVGVVARSGSAFYAIGDWGFSGVTAGLKVGGNVSDDEARAALRAALVFNGQSTKREAKKTDGAADFPLTFDALLKENPLLALHLLVASDCATDILSAANGSFLYIAEACRVFLTAGGLSRGPALIETETKARGPYALIAQNSSIEEDLTRLRFQFSPQLVEVTVSGSLLEACLGAMVMDTNIHFSVLDMTAVRNIAVKTSTQKGGLESGLLNVMQFVSNCAVEAGVFVVTETRDDFNAEGEEDENAMNRSRTTLGANSRFAVHITGSGSTRNLWVRGKGYGEFEDFTVIASAVSVSDYPENKIKPAEIALDLIAEAQSEA